MNNNNSTVTETREVIPVLTAENYADVLGTYRRRPIPAELLEVVNAAPDGIIQKVMEDIVTADGTPTKWMLDASRHEMSVWSRFLCSFPNCVGHGTVELEDTWAELSHEVAEVELKPAIEFAKPYRYDAGATIQIRDGGAVVGYYMMLEGEIPLSDLAKLADYVAQVSEDLRALHIPSTVVAD